MSTRYYPPSAPLLFGYDPERDIPADHLARLVEQVVEGLIAPGPRKRERGRPAFDLRLCLKVLIFGYAMGVRSSRQLERLCHEHLAYLYLTRGDAPSYRTLCTVRVQYQEDLEKIWQGLFAVAASQGILRLGKIVIDSTKFRADAGRESVLNPKEYEAVRVELERILKEAELVDRGEDEEGGGSGTRLGQSVETDQMRDIIRRVRSDLSALAQSEKAELSSSEGSPSQIPSDDREVVATPTRRIYLTKRMRNRVRAGLKALKAAITNEQSHLCLTDPDARMMPEGSEQKIRECHSFEVAVDNGLLVVGQTTQIGSDQLRLGAIVETAKANEPGGIATVDADSGYYTGDVIAGLIASGIDTCIPDGHTACDLRRKDPVGTTRERTFGSVPFTFVESENHYTCPQGNVLRFDKERHKGGQLVDTYIAQQECTECPLYSKCIRQPKAKHRHLYIGKNSVVLAEARKRFEEPEHQERYHQRGPGVETVFGFLRATLGFHRWSLRGKERVSCEGSLFKIAYQVRKILPAWQKGLELRAAGA